MEETHECNHTTVSMLSASQNVLSYTNEPTIYHPNKSVMFTMDMTKADSTLSILNIEPHSRRELFVIGSKEYKNMRHDWVGSLWRETTDVKMSEIDPEYSEDMHTIEHNLSPDFFDPDTGVVIELGTSGSAYESSLLRDYWKKIRSYGQIIDKYENRFLYSLIVGVDSVITNLFLSQHMVNELCLRIRMGLAMESMATDRVGQNLFSRDETPQITITKATFASITMPETIRDDIRSIAFGDMTDFEKHRVNDIKLKCMDKTREINKASPADYENYVRDMRAKGTRTDVGRISNFPLVLPRRTEEEWTPLSMEITRTPDDFPTYLACLCDAFMNHSDILDFHEEEIDRAEAEAMGEEDWERHRVSKQQKISVYMSSDALIDMAKTGINGRRFEKEPSVKAHRDKGHMGLDPDIEVDDISDFINSEHMTGYESESPLRHAEELIGYSKKLLGEGVGSLPSSMQIYETLSKTHFSLYANFLTDLCMEIARSSKNMCKEKEFIGKHIKGYEAWVILKCTGTHIFYFCIFKKSSSLDLEVGRLGGRQWEVDDYIITDFYSLNETTLEHYVKTGPYMTAIMAYMLEMNDINIMNVNQESLSSYEEIPQYWQTLKTTLLLYMCNKLEVEEIVTAQRYFIMNILDDVAPDPYRFVDRLPEVIRSRLTAYLVKRTQDLMSYYHAEPVKKRPTDLDAFELVNMRSPFCTGFITLRQKINEFYLGYVVSKSRTGKAGSSASFGICEKIYKEGILYKKNVEERNNGSVFADIDEPLPHVVNGSLLKSFLIDFDLILCSKFGKEYKLILESEIISRASKTTFSDLATLKASARGHEDSIDTQPSMMNSTRETTQRLKEDAPEEFSRRPKMIEAITNLARTYESEKGRPLIHIIELLPYCLHHLEEKGYFDSDVVPKDGRGGKREIHILEVMARICQFFFELISKFMCGWFKSETITHPKTKDVFVNEHYKASNVSYSDFITLCKSADAKTWCQRHHGDRFCAMLLRLTPAIFHGLIYRVMAMWRKKRISIPMDLIATFLANQTTSSSNPTFQAMRQDFFEGTGLFVTRSGNKIEVGGGMFQGILHYTSSLYHTVLQEVWRNYILAVSKEILNLDIIVTIVQGSDDSGALISANVETKQKSDVINGCYRLMRFKENMSELLGVYNSAAKSVMGILNFIEFNSEWYLRTSVIKPTFRWVSAALEVSLTETFVERYQQMSNGLTDVLEGGASTLTCALIQIAQANLHYKIIGVGDSLLSRLFVDALLYYPDPTLGFFPMSQDLCCGIGSYDYLLYLHAKKLGWTLHNISAELITEQATADYDTGKNPMRMEARSAKLLFGNLDIWRRLISDLELGDMEDAVFRIEEDPELIFGKHLSWQDDSISLILKVFSPGVKASLSSYQPMLRMLVASTYILSRPCFIVSNSEHKISLYKALLDKIDNVERLNNKDIKKGITGRNFDEIKLFFPFSEEYDQMIAFVEDMRESGFLSVEHLRRRSKVKLEVFSSSEMSDYEPIDLCKRKWFNKRSAVPVSETYFRSLWESLKIKCPYLQDGIRETEVTMNLNVVQLKMFLEGLSTKSRSIKLTDTASKGNSVYSAMTRIVWPGFKLRSANDVRYDTSSRTLESNLYSMVSYCFTGAVTAKKIEDLLLSSEALSKPKGSIPKRVHPLKIMRDYLEGVPKAKIVEDIAKTRSGSVGFFSTEQKFNTTTKKYAGVGEWSGVVAGASCRMFMFNDTCVKIIISTLMDFEYLSRSLRQLMKECKIKGSREPVPSKDRLYLNDIGQFTSVATNKDLVVPVEVDDKLKLTYFENVPKLNWRLVVEGTKIRIQTSAPGRPRSERITVLTYNCLFKSWDPQLPYWCDMGSCHYRFYRNEEAKRDEIETELFNFLGNRETIRDSRIRTMKSRNQYDKYNFQLLRTLLRQSLLTDGTLSQDRVLARKRVVEEAQVVEKEVSMEQVNDFIRGMNRAAGQQTQAILDASTRVLSFMDDGEEDELNEFREVDYTETGFSRMRGQILSEEHVEEINQMLEGTIIRLEEIEEIYELLNLGMPFRNRVFEGLRRDLEAYEVSQGMTSLEMIQDPEFLTDSYYMSNLFTILRERESRNFIDYEEVLEEVEDDEDKDTVQMLSEVSSFSDRKIGETSAVGRRLDELISQIGDRIPSVPGSVRSNLLMRQRELMAARRVRDTEDLDKEEVPVSITENVILNRFLNELANFMVIKKYVPEDRDLKYYDPEMYHQWLKVKLRKKIEEMVSEGEMAEMDRARYLSALSKRFLSPDAIDLVSLITMRSVQFMSGQTALHLFMGQYSDGEFMTDIITYDIVSKSFEEYD